MMPSEYITTALYYHENYEKFIENTLSIDMSHIYAEFLNYIPEKGIILDAGCGAGRDLKYFAEKGYTVLGFDNSAELVCAAVKYSGQPVIHHTFFNITYQPIFHGVWACASLLHVGHKDMEEALTKLSNALLPNGVLYASFKDGETEGMREGRFFNDYDFNKFWPVLCNVPSLSLIKYWYTTDARPNSDFLWFNILLRKEK